MPAILDKYSDFVFDVWGVLHDGHNAHAGAVDLISDLQKQGKRVFALSNAPRDRKEVYDKLAALDITIPLENIMTSGQFFIDTVEKIGDLRDVNLLLKTLVVGQERNKIASHIKRLNVTDKPEEAKNLLFLNFAGNDDEVMEYKLALEKLVNFGMTYVCINPDIVVNYGDHIVYPQGYFAKYYEALGGKVLYFGKPYREIYDYMFAYYSIDPSKALMIGDSLLTDIPGAYNVGMDSALVLTGIHKDDSDVANLLKMHTTKPTYIIDNLAGLYGSKKSRAASS